MTNKGGYGGFTELGKGSRLKFLTFKLAIGSSAVYSIILNFAYDKWKKDTKMQMHDLRNYDKK